MAKGSPRDAKQETQKIILEIPTEVFITTGKVSDPEFKVTREDRVIKRGKDRTATIHPIEVDTSLVEKWILSVVEVEANKAFKKKQKERQAFIESMKEELIADGWTPPKEEKSDKPTARKKAK